MNILVTGGAGYIGSHTCLLLEAAGHTPVVFDNLSTGRRSALRGRSLIEADLADASAIHAALSQSRVDAVMHFGGSAYIDESLSDPRKYFHNNSVNTLNLLDAMVDVGVKHFVYSSTCAVYGTPVRVPISEEQTPSPINPYGESKLFTERVLNWYGQAYGLRWTALRYFNAAGVAKELAARCDPGKRLIPLAIRAALDGKPLTVFGTDYPTPDGTAVRDYVHVADLASAHLLALEYLVDGASSRAFNLGTGIGHSIHQVLQTTERVGRTDVPRCFASRRPGDPAILVADPQAAKQLLGWAPEHSSLEEIVTSAWSAARKTLL